MDGGSRGHVDLLPGHQAEVEALKDDCQRHHSLHKGKLVTHTLTGATTEGDVPTGQQQQQQRLCVSMYLCCVQLSVQFLLLRQELTVRCREEQQTCRQAGWQVKQCGISIVYVRGKGYYKYVVVPPEWCGCWWPLPVVSVLLVGHGLIQWESLRNEGIRVIPHLHTAEHSRAGDSTVEPAYTTNRVMLVHSLTVEAESSLNPYH